MSMKRNKHKVTQLCNTKFNWIKFQVSKFLEKEITAHFSQNVCFAARIIFFCARLICILKFKHEMLLLFEISTTCETETRKGRLKSNHAKNRERERKRGLIAFLITTALKIQS
jgi:hypothetical protein